MSEQLTPEEQQLLKHLRGIKQLNHLPQVLEDQLLALENKERDMSTQKPLSHAHLKKLHKLQSQVQTQLNRIEQLDAEWKTFIGFVQDKMNMHLEMYKACRNELVELHRAKIQELAETKLLVSEASRSLMEQTPQPEPAPEAPDLDEDIAQLHQALQSESTPVTVNSDMETDPELERAAATESGEKQESKQRTIQVAAFRVGLSPTRVANFNLKNKTEKTRPPNEKK